MKNIYYKPLTLLFALAFSALSFGQTPIWTLDFETASGYTTSVTEFTDGISDFFLRTDGSGISTGYSVAGYEGSYYFAAQDIDGEEAILPVELNIDDIDISGVTDLGFSILLAEDDDGIDQDWDGADSVHIQYDIDNSGTFTDLMWIRASGPGTNLEPSIDANFDGTGDGINFITSVFQEFTATINETGSTIDIKIIFSLNSGDEDIAIDNISILGPDTEAPVATWLPTDGATQIPVASSIVISYDEAIRNIDDSEIIIPTSLITFKETDASGADVPFTAAIDITKKIITITPTSDLSEAQAYFVEIAAVEDIADNATSAENITFTTYDPSVAEITLITPAGGETFYGGDDVIVTWSSLNAIGNVAILVKAGEGDWFPLTADTEDDGNYITTIPASAYYSNQYRLAVVNLADNSIADTSDFYTIISAPGIFDIQSDTIGSGDASNFVGDTVRITGIVTAIDNGDGYFIQDDNILGSGIFIKDGANTPAVGDSVIVQGNVEENYGLTRVNNISKYTNVASGKDLPDPVVVTTNTVDEATECVLIKVINAEVTNADAGYGMIEINDGSGALLIGPDLHGATLVKGEHVTITGIGHYSYSDRKILPRDESDVVSANDTIAGAFAIDNSANAISGVPFTYSLADFESNITAPDTATMDVYDADGTTPATTIDDTKLVIVVAADGITTRTYTIDVYDAASTDATVTSSEYTVDNTAETISNVFYGTDLATFEGNIEVNFMAATFEIYEADGSTEATDLQEGYKVIVTAEDLSTKTYTISINPMSTDATASSEVYTVDQTAETITGIPFGTTLAIFEGNLTPARGATFVTYEADGTTIATDLASDYKVVVTAQDNTTTKTYTITVESDLLNLFFSEYVEGSGNNKALEIYNPNDVDVSLNSYVMRGTANGAEDWEFLYPFPADLVVGAGDVFVLADDQASAEILAVTDWVCTGYELGYNGNDSRGLFKIVGTDTNVVDVIGNHVNPDESNYSVAGVADGMLNHTIVRKYAYMEGNTDWVASSGTNADDSEWIVLGTDVIEFLGSHTGDVQSSDTLLSSITVGGVALADFSATTFTYTYELAYGTTTVPTAEATANHANAEAVVTPASDLSGDEAARTTTIVVTAENEATATYKVIFTFEAASAIADLNTIKVDGENIAGFSAVQLNYTVTLDAGTTDVPVLTYELTDQNASAVYTAAAAVPGTSTIVVTAQDGTTSKIYSVEFVVDGGINTELTTIGAVKVYPSPVNSELTIANISDAQSIHIIDMTGKTVITEATYGAESIVVDVNAIPSGLYILQVQTNTAMFSKTFIKE